MTLQEALEVLRSRGLTRVSANTVAEVLWPGTRSQNSNGQVFNLAAPVAGRMLRKCRAVRQRPTGEWDI